MRAIGTLQVRLCRTASWGSEFFVPLVRERVVEGAAVPNGADFPQAGIIGDRAEFLERDHVFTTRFGGLYRGPADSSSPQDGGDPCLSSASLCSHSWA